MFRVRTNPPPSLLTSVKLILASESEPVALALQSIKSVTGKAEESSCSKYLQRDTVVGFAEVYVFLSGKCSCASPERKRKGERGRGKWEIALCR